MQGKKHAKSATSPKKLILEKIAEAFNYTKSDMCRLMGVSRRAYDGYLYNGKTPKESAIVKLIKAGVHPWFYFTGQGNPLGWLQVQDELPDRIDRFHVDTNAKEAHFSQDGRELGVRDGLAKDARKTLLNASPDELLGRLEERRQAHIELMDRVSKALHMIELLNFPGIPERTRQEAEDAAMAIKNKMESTRLGGIQHEDKNTPGQECG